MRFRPRTFVLLTACALMGAGCWYAPESQNAKQKTQNQSSDFSFFTLRPAEVRSIDADRFAIPELDGQATRRLTGEDTFVCGAFRAGIVNHHVLASDLLAGFFRVLKRCRPDLSRFIILSPDHNLAAQSTAVTHRLPYRAGGRDIASDAEAVARLVETVPFVREQSALFEREHGVGALVPFLADAFPDAALVPVVLRQSSTAAERERLAVWLADESNDPATFIVVSADMSHYLSEQRAKSKDQFTKRALETGDEAFFQTTKDDFTDNGKSIAIVLEALPKTKWTPLGESISSAYTGSSLFTTTYLVGFW
ncbi:MAG: AmmeMemoRadiSam system protein B [Candidatus Uhrbacteria bacterium]|nr:AmmeMemoRadiSam system protein B [Candidatus Uhrbacteria bacterium]